MRSSAWLFVNCDEIMSWHSSGEPLSISHETDEGLISRLNLLSYWHSTQHSLTFLAGEFGSGSSLPGWNRSFSGRHSGWRHSRRTTEAYSQTLLWAFQISTEGYANPTSKKGEVMLRHLRIQYFLKVISDTLPWFQGCGKGQQHPRPWEPVNPNKENIPPTR